MHPEVKAQPIRLLDVVFIGPLMVWGGYALDRGGHPVAGSALALLGLGTVIYNARNYEIVKRRHERNR